MTEPVGKLGKYSLMRHLATGGMAEIWLAEQAGPGGFNKELVIKRILPHFAEDTMFTTMFLDEARLAAQLSHPKIAQIYELGEIDSQYFIAMEYIQGIDLDVMLQIAVDAGESIPVAVVCKIVMDVLEALDYAHDFTDRAGQPFNLVHRDVSPHNVLVSNDGIVKLCDFGVAKAKANQTKTQPGAVKGKFAYMAPEQIQNADDLDRRADVFAAGIMFYELLTGEKPFGDELAAINNIIAAPHPDVTKKRPDVPPQIKDIIDRALAKDRGDRYPDAHSMMRDIESFVRGLPDYVGDRELSKYVRTVQGLPVTRHSQPVPIEISDSAEEPVDVVGPTPPPVPNRVTNREPKVGPTETARISDGPTEPGVRSDTQKTDIKTKSNAGLYAIAFVVIGGIVAAIVVIAAVILPPPDGPPEEQPKTKEPIVVQELPVNNEALLKIPGDNSRLVTISSRPDAKLYVDGKLVGTTPFRAFLPPGKYKVEFRTPKDTRTETFEVTPTTSSARLENGKLTVR